MASMIPVSAPTAQAFSHNIPAPLPVVVLLADTDIAAPQPAPLLLHADIHRSTVGPHRHKTSHPRSRANTPYLKPKPDPAKSSRQSPAPSRRETSPLSEPESEDPVTATAILIPRPVGVQRGVESFLNIPEQRLKAIKKKIAEVAMQKLDPQVSWTRQEPAASKDFENIIHTSFPCLLDYQDDWALTNLTAAWLKNTKAQLKGKNNQQKLISINATMKG